jgi:acyl-coenzyme A synthetase/AMP-(fatty) acid ligase
VVVLADELPRTPSGKVRKDVLRAARKTEARGC